MGGAARRDDRRHAAATPERLRDPLASVRRVSDPSEGRSVVECGGYHFFCRNREEFERICQDVFDGHEYGFETRRRAPLIIDAGAHVGVATHYFKHHYPHARVLALEANPVTFALLRKNISHNGLDDVRAIHAALAPEAGTIPFYASASDEEPGAWGDSAIQQPWHEGEATAVVQVPAVTLSSLLTEPVDLLKLDIEGWRRRCWRRPPPTLPGAAGDPGVPRHATQPRQLHLAPDRDPARSGFTPEVRQFGEEVALSAIQEDDPYWLMVRAERLAPGNACGEGASLRLGGEGRCAQGERARTDVLRDSLDYALSCRLAVYLPTSRLLASQKHEPGHQGRARAGRLGMGWAL